MKDCSDMLFCDYKGNTKTCKTWAQLSPGERRIKTAESALVLGTMGLGLLAAVIKFSPLKTGVGLIALDQLVFRPIRESNARRR